MTTRQSVEDTALRARALRNISSHSRNMSDYAVQVEAYVKGLRDRHKMRKKRGYNPVVR